MVFGPGRLAAVVDEVRRLGSGALVISDPADAPAQRVVDDLDDVVRARITEVVAHVPVPSVEAAVTTACEVPADVLVCVGGGSSTGLAKGVARELGILIVAVPTTYAGSETTSIWGLTEGSRKATGRTPTVRPRAVVYDPEMTAGLPVPTTVTSGINAGADLRVPAQQLHADPRQLDNGNRGAKGRRWTCLPGRRCPKRTSTPSIAEV